MAEGALRAEAAKAGLDWRIDSVGTASYHIGDTPDPRAVAVAQANGVDISGFQGRQLGDQDFTQFTHIFALDTSNLSGIKARAPSGHTAQIALLMDVFEDRQGASVADPYYGDEGDFEECWSIVSKAAIQIVETLALSKSPKGSV